MGLGADKVVLGTAAPKTSTTKDEEQLKMIKGAYVKIVAGMNKGHYAQVSQIQQKYSNVSCQRSQKCKIH